MKETTNNVSFAKTATVVSKNAIGEMWENIISRMNDHNKRVTFIISDVDGTLNENDPEICKTLEKAKVAKEPISFMIATGRSGIERKYSTHHKGDCLAKHSPIMICQGGSVISVENAEGRHDYVIPLEEDINEIADKVAEALEMSRQQMFREECICIHYYILEEGREVIGIPIAKADEEWMKHLLEQYDGNIVEACLNGALEGYDIAIREYLDRGMPPEAIGVLYESELSEKIITELTIVSGNLKKCQELFGDQCKIQQHIADRYPGTRGAAQDVKPDITDIVTISKKEHVDAIINLMKERGMTIGLGDQFNDNFLYSTTYSFVANAAPIGKTGGWDFAINMANKACEYANNPEKPKVIHARKDSNLINWAVEAIINAETFEERKALCEEMATSNLNLALRKWLQDGAKLSSKVEMD